MTIGIGGAGSRLAAKLDPEATIVNVSESELSKVEAGRRVLAVLHGGAGQLRGSRKDPQIGRDAFLSVKRELLAAMRGDVLFSSTGGGTGNGISASILDDLAAREAVPATDKTLFVLVLPYARLEPAEYVANTLAFLQGPLSDAIDSGNTGNIVLLSNQLKFESRLPEAEYNQMIIDSFQVFLAIPDKGDRLALIDGHIDHEDFLLYTSKPYFNHFTYFDLDPTKPFGEQLDSNLNPLLLEPDAPIEAMFLLEVPPDGDPAPFYDILEHFARTNVTPSYGVVQNPERKAPFVTVSLLYSRKPAELVDDFNRASQAHAQAKVEKSLEQYVPLPKLEVNLQTEAKRMAKQKGAKEDDILVMLRRLGKL